MSNQFGPYPAKSRHRHLVTAFVEFTPVNDAAPTVVDHAGVLDVTTPATRTGEGVVRLNLREDWAAIFPFVELVSTTVDFRAHIAAVVETAGSQSVSIASTDSDVAADLPTVVHKVRLDLLLSNDA